MADEVDDWQPVGQQQAEVDDWQPVGAPMAAESGGLSQIIPEAFKSRIRQGEAIARIAKKAGEGFKEGFGEDRLGFSDATVGQLQELGIYHDPLRGRPSPIQLVNESVMQPTAALVDAIFRGVSGGVHGAGALVGEIVDQSGGRGKAAEREVINFGNFLMVESGFGRFSRPTVGRPKPGEVAQPIDEVIGTIPREADFKIAAEQIGGDAAANLRRRWEEDGIHPAEALDDARNDAWARNELKRAETDPAAKLPAEAWTPEALTAAAERDVVGYHWSPREFDVYSKEAAPWMDVAGPEAVGYMGEGVYLAATAENAGLYRGLAKASGKVEGEGYLYTAKVNADPGRIVDLDKPFSEQSAFIQETLRPLIEAQDDFNKAFKIKNAGRSEDLPVSALADAYINMHDLAQGLTPGFHQIVPWLKERGVAGVRHTATVDAEGSLAGTASKGDLVIFDPKDVTFTKRDGVDIAGTPRSLGAAATPDPPLIPLTEQPAPPPGRLSAIIRETADTALDMGRDLQMMVAPMARGSTDSMAIAKDFANSLRRNRWEWSRIDEDVARRFTPEQRKRMWDAADEESVARQLGESREHQGLATLTPEERAAVEDLQTRAQLAWARARDMGMVEGEGLPAYTPRMIVNVAEHEGSAVALNSIGSNLKTTTPGMKRRKYMTAEETEAAAKKALGEEAEIARDIRVLPLATAKLEDAIAGRTLIDNIKEYGKRTGDDVVSEGSRPGPEWFTLDHPAFRTWRPKMEKDPLTGKMRAATKDGQTVFEQVPLYVRGEFKGPLRAVLDHKSNRPYGALMALKGKTMSLIMNSPMIHNAVEWGRALFAMPGKVATFKVYFEGFRAKNDPAIMREAIDAGLVPIGKRFFNQDITSIMEAPDLTPGRSWTAKVLAAVPGLFDEAAGVAVKRAIDKAGDFWHNTLLWDRIADLQMGLYTNFQADAIAKGIDRQTASRMAAHYANRYAGALPKEAMSDVATKIANMMLFSRSFTLGNLGVMKDMLTGLPKDVLAQIERDGGFRKGAIESAVPATGDEVAAYAKSMARRKAMAIVALDIAGMYALNSIFQSASNMLLGDRTLSEEMYAYTQRLANALTEVKEHPMKLLQPFHFLESVGATSENEPGKGERVLVGYSKDGTAIYGRMPVGKIGEEFVGYLTGPLDMLRRKLGTIARPGWQILSNDAGFGRKVYDPTADTSAKYVKNLGLIAWHIMKSQTPEGQINAFADLVKGEGDPKVNVLQAAGPIIGATFSKGAPGGPAVGEMYAARSQHQFAVDAALPDIRRQIQRGDVSGAMERMTELGIPAGLQKFYVKTSLNPATRLSPRAIRDFYLYATPEQRDRMERAR